MIIIMQLTTYFKVLKVTLVSKLINDTYFSSMWNLQRSVSLRHSIAICLGVSKSHNLCDLKKHI